MNNAIICKLDYFRLQERVLLGEADPAISGRLLHSLRRKLEQATLLDSSEIPANVATMNSVLKIRYLESGKELKLRLVYPEQADIRQNQVSILAPLAMALLGSRENDVVMLALPSRVVKIRIDRILYQPEAAGDFSL